MQTLRPIESVLQKCNGPLSFPLSPCNPFQFLYTLMTHSDNMYDHNSPAAIGINSMLTSNALCGSKLVPLRKGGVRHRSSTLIGLIFFLSSQFSYGQVAPIKAKSFRDRVVDKVTLAENTLLWGLVLEKKPARLLVNTMWLKSQAADLFANEIQPELRKDRELASASLADVLKKDIERLKQQTPDDLQRIGLLKEVVDRLLPDDSEEPDYVIIEIPKVRLRNVETQADAHRELCRLAILNNIADIEETHWKSITQQLQAIPENARRIHASNPDSDDQLQRQRILAALDIRLSTAVRLIQSGDNVIDEAAKPDLGAIMSTMLGGNVQDLLGELLNEGGTARKPNPTSGILPEAAQRIAESKGSSTVLLSGFSFQIASGSASVTRRLFRKVENSQWKLLFATQGTSTAADLKPGQVESIQNDPQIKEIAGLIEGLGLGGGQFANALQMGAVVQNAMRNAEQAFETEIQNIITAKDIAQAKTPPLIVLSETPLLKAAP